MLLAAPGVLWLRTRVLDTSASRHSARASSSPCLRAPHGFPASKCSTPPVQSLSSIASTPTRLGRVSSARPRARIGLPLYKACTPSPLAHPAAPPPPLLHFLSANFARQSR